MKRLLGVIILLTLVFLGLLSCAPAYRDTSIAVGGLSTQTLSITMSKGKTLEGYMTVRGGNDDINFYLKDSYGSKVLNVSVKGRYDFSYKATSDGYHTAYFDNTFSFFTGKEVLLHYRVR